MKVTVWLLGAYLIVIGIMTILSPDVVRRISRWFLTPIRLRVSTLLSVAWGILVFLGRHSTGTPMFTGVVGLVIAVTGLMYLLLPWSTAERINKWSLSLSDSALRMYAVAYILIGIALLAAKR